MKARDCTGSMRASAYEMKGPLSPMEGFWGSSAGKESTCNAGDLGSIPGLGRSPGGGHGNLLQYSCLENSHGQRSLVGYSPWGFSRQEYWSGLPCPPPGDLPNSGIEPRPPALQADSLPSEPPGKPLNQYTCLKSATLR